ncbi:DNA repair protein UVH3 isoform X2 [Prunus dulcis]|uniref:DNA repair protein UVH3 isoform X2 n=1 Tax=Prunus dulcis TaxID=3755 RepID=UPI0014822A33|nr:DNA repair protein UVH3 isoform X2 [Prunus dulcis]
MGVHGLWELLAPVGRRVSVETLAGRRLAIDASIWMVQFMKAMRDEKGEMVRNAHVLGFFRRICKLLYLRTKPVFVFDGGTPALKRRTVIARRRQRENAQSKLRKTAEKLLLNHLKAMKLKVLAEDIKNQRQNQKNDAKGKQSLPDQTGRMGDDNLEKNDMALLSSNQEKLDEMLAASIQAEEEGGLAKNASKFTAAVPCEEDSEEDDEEMILPEMNGEVDPAVLANLPPSMQLGLLLQSNKQDNEAKGKKIMSDQTEMVGINLENCEVVSRSCNQEKLDEMIAASIAAEEDAGATNNASTSTASIIVEEDVDEDGDDDEEMILPEMHGKVDPAVLAALPPSMQLDLLVQIRERLMAENRQKYQKVKKDPGKFSELQIQSYLKTVAFRREIDQVQKAAAGRGVSGVHSSRIASEAHREFIFSSSFTGDKQVLASARADKNGDKQQAPKEHPSNFRNSVPSTNNVTGATPDESTSVFDDNIETYLDERGHLRVSRVRAMGIRMTRDLQRNLDLMKEIEQEKTNTNKIINTRNLLNERDIDISKSSCSSRKFIETSCGDNVDSIDTGVLRSHPGQKKVLESSVGDNSLNDRNNQCTLKLETPIEISIEDGGESKSFDGDDDLFASLVAGNAVTTNANDILRKQSSGSDSDCDWEEGTVEVKSKVPCVEGNMSDDSEVEWEEGVCGITENTSSFPHECGKTVSKGYFEEEANFQEAIRRSLEDIGDEKCAYASSAEEKLQSFGGEAHKGAEFIDRETKIVEAVLVGKIGKRQNESSCDIVDGVKKMKSVTDLDSPPAQTIQNVSERENFCGGMQCAESVTPSGTKEVHMITEQVLGTFNEDDSLSTLPNTLEKNKAHSFDALSCDATNWVDDQKNEIEAEPSCHIVEMANPAALTGSLTEKLTNDCDVDKTWVKEKSHDNFFQESEHSWDKSSLNSDANARVEATEANLEEEMLILGQECTNLGDEQRRLERNVESVSSEMFTECQELLQMFGIPYIIAPMEAEAQCAYMELTNLVDGVVTDDSDVFLFGAQSVYKNIFDDRKYVETYFMKDVEKELGLSREKLIRMALLLGSDYTEGVSGIGIVNAIEVVNAFPEEDGLHKFRDWIESPDPTILGKFDGETGSSAKKRGSKFGDKDINSQSNKEEVSAFDQNNCPGQEHKQSADLIEEIKQTFMDKHRKVSKNWHIPSSFPSEAVSVAYTCPQVDKSTEPFTWGKPDHFVLRKLCWEKFGWGTQKADELLIPVLKEYVKRETQLRLEAFYTFNERFARIRSKRIKKAVKGIAGNQSSELIDDAAQEVSRSRKKGSISTDEPGGDKSEKLSEGTEKGVFRDQRNSKGKSTIKQLRKRRTTEVPVPSDRPKPAEMARTTNRRLHANGKGRGRGRKVLGRGKGKENPSAEASETSSSKGDDDDDDGMDLHMETVEGSGEVRRSGRLRKPVNYRVNDLENDDVDDPLDHCDTKCSNEESGEQLLSWDEGKCEEGSSRFSEKKQQNAGNLSPNAGLCNDYLETGGGFCPVEDETGELAGGGFCPDEDETGELGLSQHHDPSFEAEVSEDYLKMGGRLCRDGQIGNDRDEIGVQATAAASEDSDLPNFSGYVNKVDFGNASVQSSVGTKRPLQGFEGCERTGAYDAEQSINDEIASKNDDHSKLSVLLQENTVDNSGQPSVGVGALSAMPFLRKKRRQT